MEEAFLTDVRRDGARNSHGRRALGRLRAVYTPPPTTTLTPLFPSTLLPPLFWSILMPILVYLTAESFVWGFCEKPYPDSGREEMISYRHGSSLSLMPVHIQPDFAIIDRPLSTVGVSTAPASPEVHALRQPASGRCDKQPPACYTTETIPCRSRHVKTVNCLNETSITNLLLQSARLGNYPARSQVSNLSLDSSPPQQRPRDLPHAKQLPCGTDKRRS